jgi:hypothetical protein
MVRVEVPVRAYEKAVREMQASHRSMWALMDLVPGGVWRVHAAPWERIEDVWKAEDVLKALREALRAARPKTR